MKKFKKIITLIMALIICFAPFVSVFADTDEEPDFPCGGVIEEVKVQILYAPIESLIVFGDSELELSGVVLKITYPSGEYVILTVENIENQYYAGDFVVSFYDFNNTHSEECGKYGLADKDIHLYFDKKHGGYSGGVNLFYIRIPSVSDIFDLVFGYLNISF